MKIIHDITGTCTGFRPQDVLFSYSNKWDANQLQRTGDFADLSCREGFKLYAPGFNHLNRTRTYCGIPKAGIWNPPILKSPSCISSDRGKYLKYVIAKNVKKENM